MPLPLRSRTVRLVRRGSTSARMRAPSVPMPLLPRYRWVRLVRRQYPATMPAPSMPMPLLPRYRWVRLVRRGSTSARMRAPSVPMPLLRGLVGEVGEERQYRPDAGALSADAVAAEPQVGEVGEERQCFDQDLHLLNAVRPSQNSGPAW